MKNKGLAELVSLLSTMKMYRIHIDFLHFYFELIWNAMKGLEHIR